MAGHLQSTWISGQKVNGMDGLHILSAVAEGRTCKRHSQANACEIIGISSFQ